VASFAAMGLFWGAWAALVPEIKRVVDAPDGPFGLALLAVGLGSVPAMITAGRVQVRLGRALLVACLIAFAIASATLLVAGSLPALAVAMLMIGAASGALDVAMNSEISQLEASSGRRLMFGAHALFSLALLVGSIGTGLVRDAGGDRFTVLPPVAAFAVALALVAAITPSVRTTRAAGSDDGGRAAGPWLLALGVICAGSFLVEDAAASWGALHLERTLGATPAIGGAGPGVFAGAMFVGRSAGQLVGRHFSDRLLVVAGGVGAAIGAALAGIAPTAPVALVGFAIAGGSIALVAPALFARAGRLAAPENRGRAISTLTTIGYLGFVVGPGIVGALAGATSLPLALVAVGGVSLAVAVAGLAALR
jgi:MFS family permease